MFKRIIENAFNNAINKQKDNKETLPYLLSPKFFKMAENYLKTYSGDMRYSLFVLASSSDSCLVKYHHMKYWVTYNHIEKKYETESYEHWR